MWQIEADGAVADGGMADVADIGIWQNGGMWQIVAERAACALVGIQLGSIASHASL